MSNTIEFEGRTEQEAVHKACAALKVAQEDLDYVVIDEGSSGVLGFGARPVQIRVRHKSESAESTPVQSMGDSMTFDGLDSIRSGIIGPAPEKAAQAEKVASELVMKMGLESAKITVRDEERQIVVVIEDSGEDNEVARILGRNRPPAIPSFQFLLNKIVNRFPENRKHIVVEVPSVPRREKQKAEAPTEAKVPQLDPELDEELVALGNFLAKRVLDLGRVITIHPMLPGDRRAIHQSINVMEGVGTVSEGEGLYRRMHVIPEALGGSRKKRRRRRRRRKKEGNQAETTRESENNEAASTAE